MSESSKSGSIEISKALIGCTGVVLAAIIGGIFLLISTDVIKITLSSPTASQSSTDTPASTIVAPPQSENLPTVSGLCYGTCWEYNHSERTMTWTGPTDGMEDIWQPEGGPLEYIRGGYTAIFETTVPLKMAICIGEVDGATVSTQCNPQILDVAPGKHRVISSGPQGGFRVGPDPKFGP
jgi:hypothetical protein